MRIVCPDCAAEYEVPVERIAPGRNVRCAKCGIKWAPLPALPPPALPPAPIIEAAQPPAEPVIAPAQLQPVEPDALPEESPTPSESAAAPAGSGKLLLALAWLASIVILGAAGYAAVTYRTAVIQAWPPSARAYLWLGLAR